MTVLGEAHVWRIPLREKKLVQPCKLGLGNELYDPITIAAMDCGK